jgi:hypothetical protein
MINFEQVKQITIEVEQEWILSIEGDLENVNGTIDEINNCNAIDDLVRFYEERGYDNKEAYETIIFNLMALGSIK